MKRKICVVTGTRAEFGLLRWLMQKGWTHFTVRDVNRNGPRFARKSADHTASLLVVLITHRWLSSRDGKTFEVRHVSPQ